jgi:hypothetical protein
MKGVQTEMETLWPYKGFAVRTRERKLGEGKLTLTEQSLLFEAKDGTTVGFDLPTLRLVRLADVHTVELAYSIQGELRSASFRIVCTFGDGTERDEIPSRDDSYRMSLFRAITGGVMARFLADHSDAKVEGLTRMTDDKFEAKIKDLATNISLFPDKKQYDEDVWWDEDLHKRSLEAAKEEPEIWDDPYRDRLLYTGAGPSMNVDNVFEKLDLLQEDWVSGKLSPSQRAKSVAMDYKAEVHQAEMGYEGEGGESPDAWRKSASKLIDSEKRLGVELSDFI